MSATPATYAHISAPGIHGGTSVATTAGKRKCCTPEAIRKRIDLYHRETEPLVSHYRLAGNLVGIHGNRPENEVFAEIQQSLDQARVAP